MKKKLRKPCNLWGWYVDQYDGIVLGTRGWIIIGPNPKHVRRFADWLNKAADWLEYKDGGE